MPRGSLQIGLPCLEKYASSRVRTPEASSRSSRPSSISSRTACGSTLIPTPSGLNSDTLSNILAATPIWCRLSASVNPPIPPPAISTVMIRPRWQALSWHGSAAVGNCEGGYRRRGWTARGRAVNLRLSHEDGHVQALLYPRHLRARFPHCAGGGRRRLHDREGRLQNQSAEQPGLSGDQPEGACAVAGDRSRHPDRDAVDAGLHRAEFSAGKTGAARRCL